MCLTKRLFFFFSQQDQCNILLTTAFSKINTLVDLHLNQNRNFIGGMFFPAIYAVRRTATWVRWKCALWNNILHFNDACMLYFYIQCASLQHTYLFTRTKLSPLRLLYTLRYIYMYLFGRYFYLKWLKAVQGNLTNWIKPNPIYLVTTHTTDYDLPSQYW